MLSPAREEDDDDNHLCIKCNATVMGLDNYIKHRKERCAKPKYGHKTSSSKNEVVTSINSLDTSYNLGADVFFQSLELQSSSKRNLHGMTLPITVGGKSELAKPPSTNRRVSPIEPSTRGEDWIGGHSLRIVSNEDNQTKLIKAVANISGAVRKEIPTSSYNIPSFHDYKPDEDTNDESEVSDDDEDDDHAPTGAKWKPPPNYTGGKWQPGGVEVAHWNIRHVSTPDPDNIGWDMREEGGKWKPILTQPESKHGDEDRDDDYDVPPPGHTKGKWVPGTTQADKTPIMQPVIQTKGSIQYWCGPCNRRLGSRVVYEKHLISNLHLRRTLLENDLEYSGYMGTPRYSIGKRTQKPSQYTNDTLYTQIHRKRYKIRHNSSRPIKTRYRRPYFVHCSGCKSRVRTHLMGKHLISHYHFRKASATGDVYKQLILDNIGAIVYQSPFQCSPCKFYTNWMSNFMQHWFSEEHQRKIQCFTGKLWCSFCKFECESSNDMVQHLKGDDHTEVVSVINRSMPIIIRKKTIFSCTVCKTEFRYNIELKHHTKNTGHDLAHSASDAYQEAHKCQYCSMSFMSSLALVSHLKKKHKQEAYFCLVCSLSFNTTSEAKQHRFSLEHRIKRKERLQERGVAIKDLSRKCPYCIPHQVLKNVLELKDHIRRCHPGTNRKCPKCGISFLLPQEVTRHIRNKACQFQDPSDLLDPITNAMLWHCSQCLYSTDSQAECLFHEALHSNPIPKIYKSRSGSKHKTVLKYECPQCLKCFRKPSLRLHLRQHTLEKPFRCSKCSTNFTRLSSLVAHSKSRHNDDSTTRSFLGVAEESQPDGKDFTCSVCGENFKSKSILDRHASVHGAGTIACSRAGCTRVVRTNYELREHEAAAHSTERSHACDHHGCEYASKTWAQLVRHKKIHTERVMKYKCTVCSFKTDQSSHLKRHMRTHEGTKSYQCPHCEFSCADLTNLRKHVLKSRHPNDPLYTCADCPPEDRYTCNLATEFRRHLIQKHTTKYDNKNVVDYVAQFFYRLNALSKHAQISGAKAEGTDIIISPNEKIYKDILQLDDSSIVEYTVADNGSLEPCP